LEIVRTINSNNRIYLKNNLLNYKIIYIKKYLK
jgi:hypothetical protein